jgi:uncharacterized DUF497 family protein
MRILICMKVTWDEPKRQTNIRDHGFDLVDAQRLFAGPTWVVEDTRFAYGEQRFVAYGLIAGRFAVCVFVHRGDARHILSLRKGTKHEERTYFRLLTD